MADKRKPSISIVIPVLNEENRLAACLDSIAAQTELPDEVIVVDNGSTDKSIEIASRYQFVTVLREPKRGIVYARNTGFNAVHSDIIGRIDADTHLPDYWVAYVKDFYSHSECLGNGLTGGGYFYNLRFPHFMGWIQSQLAYRMNRLLLGHYIFWGSNMALPRKIWLEVKNDTCKRVDIHEDLDLAIHTHAKGVPISYHTDLDVGVQAKRTTSHHDQLLANLLLWPHTLRIHRKWTWIFGWLGAMMLFILSPILSLNERVARLFGKQPLPH